MPTATRKTQTLFTEDLEAVEEPRVWRDDSVPENPPQGSYYTRDDLAAVLDRTGLESILFETVEIRDEWGFIFPGERTRTASLYRVTPYTVGDFAQWERALPTVTKRENMKMR